MEGKIKFFDTKKGYGFIVSKETGKEIFVHYTDVLGKGPITFEIGDKVDFELGTDGKGKPKAIMVSLVK